MNCGNCNNYNKHGDWCNKHYIETTCGTLCTGWERKYHDIECVECGTSISSEVNDFWVDDVRVCVDCFTESTKFKNDEVIQPNNEMLEIIEEQCKIMANTLKSKNADYGNSFEHTLNKYGDTALMLRLEDKFNRLESLFKNKENLVKDEGFEDTLRDLAGYCLLYLSVKNK